DGPQVHAPDHALEVGRLERPLAADLADPALAPVGHLLLAAREHEHLVRAPDVDERLEHEQEDEEEDGEADTDGHRSGGEKEFHGCPLIRRGPRVHAWCRQLLRARTEVTTATPSWTLTTRT